MPPPQIRQRRGKRSNKLVEVEKTTNNSTWFNEPNSEEPPENTRPQLNIIEPQPGNARQQATMEEHVSMTLSYSAVDAITTQLRLHLNSEAPVLEIHYRELLESKVSVKLNKLGLTGKAPDRKKNTAYWTPCLSVPRK